MNKRSVIAIAAAELSSIGGIQTYVQNLAFGLKEREWNVHFIATNNRGDYYNELSRSVNCHDLSMIRLNRKKVYAVADLLKEIAPDILLMNHSSLIHYSLPLLPVRIKPVAILHSHDPRFYRVATSFGPRVFRWIAPTIKLAEYCKRYLSSDAYVRIRVIPHGVNEKVFFKDPRSLDARTRSIIFVGSLDKHKGADILPDIFMAVLKKYSNVQIHIIGKGPLRPHLEKLFEEFGIAQFIKFHGTLRSADLANILRVSDLLVLPTRLEGFGLVIVEAMMCGVIPIVSNLHGITDQIIEHGKTGFLIAQNDIGGFADAINYLIGNAYLIDKMGTETSANALKQFSQRIMLDSYEKLFAENDDRTTIKQRNRIGWVGEALSDQMRKDVDGKIPFMNLVKLIQRKLLRELG